MPAAATEIEEQRLDGETRVPAPGRGKACRLAAGLIAAVAVVSIVIAVVSNSGSAGSSSVSVAALGPSSLGDGVWGVTAGIWDQQKMPLTEALARDAGWTLVDDDCCGGLDDLQCWAQFALGKAQLYGKRYRLGTRLTPTLMYDHREQLAGMQITVDTESFPLYPDSNLDDSQYMKVGPGSSEAGLTLHFMDPLKICRGAPVLSEGSLGDRLYVRTANGFESIPLQKSEDDSNLPSGYSGSGCAPRSFAYPGSPGMGTHYWRNLKTPLGKDLACHDTGPMFLLYNDENMLTAFGFTYVSDKYRVPTVGNEQPTLSPRGSYVMSGTLPTKELWEFAQQNLSPFFFTEEENPTCLKYLNTFQDSAGNARPNENLENGTVTTGTLHIFVSNPYNILC